MTLNNSKEKVIFCDKLMQHSFYVIVFLSIAREITPLFVLLEYVMYGIIKTVNRLYAKLVSSFFLTR